MTMAEFDAVTPLYFRVEASYDYSSYYKNLGEKTKAWNQDISGINLGTVNIGVTLSGTIDVKLDGQTPSEAYVRVFNEGYNNSIASSLINNGAWSMTMAEFDAETPLYFRVEVNYDYSSYYKNLGEKTKAWNQDISGINLGTVNIISAITLSGALNVTYAGSPPYQVEIYFLYQDGRQIASPITLSQSGFSAWSKTIPPFDTAADIKFLVRGFISSSFNVFNVFSKYVEGPRGVTDQDITDIVIDLGDIPGPFDDAIPLVENTWTNGSINNSNEFVWYSIPVTEATTYYFWWNDSRSGDYSQSVDITVGGLNSNKDIVFAEQDSAWNSPVPFTANSNDTVYIRVRGPYSYGDPATGTYQIVYSKTSTRPTR
jgi:hypothetical protein